MAGRGTRKPPNLENTYLSKHTTSLVVLSRTFEIVQKSVYLHIHAQLCIELEKKKGNTIDAASCAYSSLLPTLETLL